MSTENRTKVTHMHQSIDSSDLTDSGDVAEQVSHCQSFQESRSVKKSTSDHTLYSSDNVSRVNLFKHIVDFMYPIPRSIRSPQIEIFQNGLYHYLRLALPLTLLSGLINF